jgi:protein-disulfide isomerase
MQYILIIIITLFSISSFANNDMEQIIDKRVEKLLLDKPEIIIKALEEYQKKEAQKAEDAAKNSISEHYAQLTNLDNTPYLGDKNNKNILIEFSDYMCGYCKMFSKVIQEIHKNNPDILIILRETPILGENSYDTAKFAIAVYTSHPNKFWEFHEKLMSSNINGKEDLLNIVKELGMDSKKIEKEASSDKIAKILADNLDIARKINLRGTPTFIFNGELVAQTLSNEYIQSKKKK